MEEEDDEAPVTGAGSRIPRIAAPGLIMPMHMPWPEGPPMLMPGCGSPGGGSPCTAE